MVYVSFVEILVKSLDAFSQMLPDKTAYSFATLAFFAGVIMLVAIDSLIPNPHKSSQRQRKKRINKRSAGWGSWRRWQYRA